MAISTVETAATTVPVDLIDADPDQPRKHFDTTAHDTLVDSIRAEGLLQPIGVRPVGERYVIVYGERRLRAVQALGWSEIPVVELSRDNHLDLLVLQLVENMMRADLHPVEEAHAFRRLIDAGMTATEVAERIGKSKSYISHKLSLLTLPDPLGIYLDAGLLSEGQVRQLLRLKTFYGDRTRTMKAGHVPDDAEAWPDEVVIPAAVLSFRPLDWPPGFHIPDFDGEQSATIARSARALAAGVLTKPAQPEWMLVTWFYATMLVSFDGTTAGTVTAARTFVERHIDLVTSAMVAVFSYGDDPHAWGDHLEQDGWLYLSDLRHAGFRTDSATVQEWVAEHLDLVVPLVAEDGTGLAAPSARQPGGPQHRDVAG